MRVVTFAALLFPLSAFAANWKIDPAHSRAHFKVRHMMVTTVHGQFKGITGTVDYDPAKPTEAKIDVAIDASTIDTREEKRDGHLKSADFFDVANHPKLTFKSKAVKKTKEGFDVEGDLTMRGVTKPVTLKATVTEPVKAMGRTVVGVNATTRVNRQDFGIAWNQKLETGGWLVGNDVDIELDLEIEQAK